RRSATPRPSAAPERLRHPAADDIGRRRRKPRHGSSTANQHRQAPRPFPVPARLPALRSHPQHARGTAAAARRAIRRTPAPKPILLPGVRHRVKMRGYMSCRHGLQLVKLKDRVAPPNEPSWYETEDLLRVELTSPVRAAGTAEGGALLPYRSERERQQRVGYDPFAKSLRKDRNLREADGRNDVKRSLKNRQPPRRSYYRRYVRGDDMIFRNIRLEGANCDDLELIKRPTIHCGSPSIANERNFAYLSPTLRSSLYCAEFHQF